MDRQQAAGLAIIENQTIHRGDFGASRCSRRSSMDQKPGAC
jgi:hypothetical protein